jgi:hypothetical protein
MRKAIAGVCMLVLFICLPVLAQYGSQPASQGQGQMSGETAKATPKLHHIKGTIGDDGKTFTSDKDKSKWTIVNPDAVKGHEGHHVVLSAHVYPDKNEVHVMSVKMAGASSEKSDSDDKSQKPMSEQPPQ